jgi:CO dehydrogenase/acetyl-CoA synthase delta subunit
MPVEIPVEQWPGRVIEETIGATPAEGGHAQPGGEGGRREHHAVHADRRRDAQPAPHRH